MTGQDRLVHRFLEDSARRSPDAVAVVHDRRRATYAELDLLADRLARGLAAAGIGPGDRVALWSENGIGYIYGYYGILKAGAAAVPLSTDLKPAAFESLAAEVRPRAVLVSTRLEQSLRPLDLAACGVERLEILDELGPGRRSSASAPPLPEPPSTALPLPAVAPEDLASIVYTSGSAGKPKGVMLTHANLVANTRSIVEFLGLTAKDVQMVVLPFFYVMGKSLLNTHIAVGGRVVINNQFAYPAAVLRQMADEGVTGFSGVPSTFAYLLYRSPLARYRERLPALRYCSQAGGHLPRPIKLRLLEALPPHTRFVVMYGATEAAARISYVPPEALLDKIDSIGVPIPGVRMDVVSPAGEVLEPGQVGELVVRGENVMAGYYRDEAATRAALDAAGYHTGDLGYRDEDGFFFVTGRRDSQLKVGGHRVDPQQVEDVLVGSGRVLECLVLGVPDPLLGRRLAALVVPIRPGPGEIDRILEHCASNLPRFKVPEPLVAVDAIPKNGSGKPDRESGLALLERSRGEAGGIEPSRSGQPKPETP